VNLSVLRPEIRERLARFYLEMNHDLSMQQCAHKLLALIADSLQVNPFVLSLCLPWYEDWAIFTLEMDDFHSEYLQTEPKPDAKKFGIVVSFGSRQGWLALSSSSNKLARQMPIWERTCHQFLSCYSIQEVRLRYQTLVDNSVDAIVVIDSLGRILHFHGGAQAMFGYSAEEVVGQSVNCLMPEPYCSEHDTYIRNYLTSGKKKIIGIGRRVPVRRKDGSIFPAHLAVTEFERDGEKFFIGTLRDISEFVEARSRATVEERRHLSRELHDSVSQALFGIVLGAQATKNALQKPEQAKEAIDYVLSLAESALAEMRTLIFELRPEALESGGLLTSLRQQIQALSKRYAIEISVDFPEEEPDIGLSFKHEVFRLTMESLHNVVKHAAAKTCEVRISKSRAEYSLSIRDDGQGFDPEKVSNHRMGLHGMRERVAQLGGRMTLQSAPQKGTFLEFFLPGTRD